MISGCHAMCQWKQNYLVTWLLAKYSKNISNLLQCFASGYSDGDSVVFYLMVQRYREKGEELRKLTHCT